MIATGNVVAAATTSSTNTTTGALVVQGGAGIAGNINVGGQIVTTAAGSATDGAGQLYLNGTTSNRIDWNTNGTGAPALTTRSAGTKVVLYPSLSASTTDYAMGIDAATMWSSVPENGASFNFKWYGAATEVASLSGTGVLKVAGNIVTSSGTASTSTTTGALVVVGGAGVSGNLNLGGNLVITGAINSPGNIIVNSTKSAATDFGVRGANDNSLVYAFADSTYDQVVIGGNITTANVSQGAKLHVNSTDAMIIPAGFTAQRPGSSGYTDVEGMIRFNKTLTSLEFFDGSIWQGTGTSFTVITSTLFSGANVDGINHRQQHLQVRLIQPRRITAHLQIFVADQRGKARLGNHQFQHGTQNRLRHRHLPARRRRRLTGLAFDLKLVVQFLLQHSGNQREFLADHQ